MTNRPPKNIKMVKKADLWTQCSNLCMYFFILVSNQEKKGISDETR